MKVVINTCNGGFSISFAGLKRYYEIKFPERKLYLYKRDLSTGTYTKVSEGEYDYDKYDSFYIDVFDKDFGNTFSAYDIDTNVFNDHFVSMRNFKRTDPVLVQVVEELGNKANGIYAELEIVELSGNKYRICEHNGAEWVETPDSVQWEKA
jgi:hypothetical protein